MRNHPLGINDPLPGHVVVVEVMRDARRRVDAVGREVFETDADLTRSLCCRNIIKGMRMVELAAVVSYWSR